MNLKILQWNIKHLSNSKPSLSKLCSETNPHVICLQETWSHSNSNNSIPGYYAVSHTPRPVLKGGGVAILASRSTAISPIHLNSTNLEACAATFHSAQKSFTILSLYIPPCFQNNLLLNELETLINSLPSPILVCTDSNGHHPAWGSPSQNQRGSISMTSSQK